MPAFAGSGLTAASRLRVEVAADAAGFIKKGRGSAAGCVEGLCSLPLRGQQPFGLRVVVSPLGR